AAAVRAVRAGELDRLRVPTNPLDILAQQMVALAATAQTPIEHLGALVRRAYPFRTLARADFDAVRDMLGAGVATRRGRRGALLHLDRVQGRVRARRGARLAAITGGGAIPDTADYDVVEEPQDLKVGTVNEDFAVESMAGDIFLLGNRSWRIRRVEAGRVRVEDAAGAPPTVPFWLGEAPARTPELSTAVSELRMAVAALSPDDEITWLVRECGLAPDAAGQLVAYVAATRAALGSPLFTNRWRGNATRSLALLRHEGGRRVPMPFQRMRAEDLLAAVFPAQVACADNVVGPIPIPDHPLVRETIDNCLHEATDLDGLQAVLGAIGCGEIATRAIETAAPSPMSHEILNSNPYTYLDDAPLEERRARAVSLRRIDVDLAGGLG